MVELGLSLVISPHGKILVRGTSDDPPSRPAAASKILEAFQVGTGAGLAHLATRELATSLPMEVAFARDFAVWYFSALCRRPELGSPGARAPVALPDEAEIGVLVRQAPPMMGSEYLTPDVLRCWWKELDDWVGQEIERSGGDAATYLRERNPAWRFVGRVTFHLAENKRDSAHPFAFLATYARRVSALGQVQHLPLMQALKEFSGAKNRDALVSLLAPIDRAAERLDWVRTLVANGAIYQPLAWSPREAHAFLRAVPVLEQSGLMVRIPDWWSASRPPRAVVQVRIGDAFRSSVGINALLDFQVDLALDGEPLSEKEVRDILAAGHGLVPLRGRWIEVNGERLRSALEHWKQVERSARAGGITFHEGMRLLAGMPAELIGRSRADSAERSWTGIAAGRWLGETLAQLRDPRAADEVPNGLMATLRPYQRTGVHWLRFLVRLGLGGCLADDMGLGKTIQIIALLLHLREEAVGGKAQAPPSLLVVPASLIANWKAEIARFAPTLSIAIVHPSEPEFASGASTLPVADLYITTYGMLSRRPVLRQRDWRIVILDEAQAIKNAGARQTRIVKELRAAARIALTGTPIENRLSDLWSLFDFLNPGLLGNAKSFANFAKSLQNNGHANYAPLKSLVHPYILRRLKTDKRVIADLPEKTELKAYCTLTKEQAAVYQQSVRELEKAIERAEGIQRRGLVLSFLMRFKQICNHPAQWIGSGDYDPAKSGKFARLEEICSELALRQDRVLIFTQFREIARPLANYLGHVFGRQGLVLDGTTPVGQRRAMVDAFQREDGPPFFVLSLKAGGVGLNLTAACQVIHFDRWWNPAVENQATDRAFRIGQRRNVLVHKFVCQGTIEERIDALIDEKITLSGELLEGGAEKLLTDCDNRELIDLVALDASKALAG